MSMGRYKLLGCKILEREIASIVYWFYVKI